MNRGKTHIPRRIWLLWFQGISKAPLLVRRCVDSWIAMNPGWDVTILDESNLSEFIYLDLPEHCLAGHSPAHRADLIRLHLLSEYGGVWADATTYCMKPLDEWVDACAESGFFAFNKPGRDRLISNWFLVAEKGCPLVVKLKDRMTAFFRDNQFRIDTRFGITRRLLAKVLNRTARTTRYWFSPVVTKLLKVYPYFVFHYMFERLIAEDQECGEIWRQTKKISAHGPHKIQFRGMFSPLTEDMKKEIDERKVAVYKLDWRYDERNYAPSTLLYYLLERSTWDSISSSAP